MSATINASRPPLDDQSLQIVDNLSPDLRRLVHEYGLHAVQTCLEAGVTRPASIAHVIRSIRGSARGGRQGAVPTMKLRGGRVLSALDPWLLAQGAAFTGQQVVRVILDQSYTVLPIQPTATMIDASLGALDGVGRVDRHQKHLMRLTAAIRAGTNSMWEPLPK